TLFRSAGSVAWTRPWEGGKVAFYRMGARRPERKGGARAAAGASLRFNPRLPRFAAEPAPTGIRKALSGELEVVDQAGGAQPRGDQGHALARAFVGLGQEPVTHDRIVDRETCRL